MSDENNILTGKWVQTNSNALPSSNISMLMDQHKKLAIADVTMALRESVKDFMAQYWVIENSDLDNMLKIQQVELDPDYGGFDFPFLKALIDLRDTETRTGIRGHMNVEDIFPTTPRPEIFDEGFAAKASDYIQMRKQKIWYAGGLLKRFRGAYGDNETETSAERVAQSTHIPLNILLLNWMKKRPVGEYTMNPFMHNIGQLAHNYLDPKSKDFADDLIGFEAQKFVSDLPYMKNRALFTKLINANMRKDHEREMEGRTGERPTVVPLPLKPEYP